MDVNKSLQEQATPRDAESYARWLLWHDGYPDALLGRTGRTRLRRRDRSVDGAVVVERHAEGWAVYRKRGSRRESVRVHATVGSAYNDAVEWIYKICRDEGL